MYKKLLKETAEHEEALNSGSLNVHTQFPGRALINLLNEGIKVSGAWEE